MQFLLKLVPGTDNLRLNILTQLDETKFWAVKFSLKFVIKGTSNLRLDNCSQTRRYNCLWYVY